MQRGFIRFSKQWRYIYSVFNLRHSLDLFLVNRHDIRDNLTSKYYIVKEYTMCRRIPRYLMLLLFIPLGSLASFIFIGSADAFSFLGTPTTEAPFELLDLNEINADYLIESSLADGFLGLEERQARYHLPYGFAGVTYFYKGNNPDAVGNDPS